MGAGWRAGGPGGRGLEDASGRPAGQTDVWLQRGRRVAGMALARAWKQMSWFYYQYLLVTALYMLEPWERTVFSILPGPRCRWGRGGPGRHPFGLRAWQAEGRRAGPAGAARRLASARRTRGLRCGGRAGGVPAVGSGPGRARTLEISGRG